MATNRCFALPWLSLQRKRRKRWLDLACEVLKHPVVSRVMMVVIGQHRVSVRPFWVTPRHGIGLLSKAQKTT